MADVYHHYLGRDGKLPKPTHTQIDRENSRAELIAAQARERIAKATLAEVELARLRRELIDRDTATRQASFIFVAMRQRLLALPAQLARKLDVPDKHAAKMVIDSAIRECLVELLELPDRVTREEYESFVETENGEKAEKPAPRRKTSR